MKILGLKRLNKFNILKEVLLDNSPFSMIPKKSLLKISFNHYLKHKIQSVLLVLGISLGVAVIVAIDIANTSARKSFDKSVRSISGNITHSIYSSTAGRREDAYCRLRKLLG